jgi:hypothetical protein
MLDIVSMNMHPENMDPRSFYNEWSCVCVCVCVYIYIYNHTGGPMVISNWKNNASYNVNLYFN